MKTEDTIEVRDKYTYNKETDTYVTPLKSRAKPLVLSGAKHRAIIRALSNLLTPSLTVEEVSLKYKIPVKYLEEYKKVHSITRDSLPLSAEEIEERDPESSATQMMEEKKFSIAQAFEKLEWKDTQKDATAWREFQANQLDPFSLALDTWTPPKAATLKLVKEQGNKNILVIGVSDLHWGAFANAKYMYNHKGGWNSEKTSAAVDEYCKKVIGISAERTYKFEKVAIFLLGDILHSVSGKTARGTELKFDIIKEEMFEYAMTGLTRFINNIAETFREVEIHSVVGNHNPEAESALYRALEAYFRTVPVVKFFNHLTRPSTFRLKNTLFLLDHGQDSAERAYVPLTDAKLEAHVQNLLLQKPELLIGLNSRVFIMGDRHHFRHHEYDNFDFLMFGTSMLADEHAAVNNWNNRARQNCLVLDDSGIKEVLHFYVDSLISEDLMDEPTSNV